jgi:hypothetical protein
MSARARLGALHDRSGLDRDGLAHECTNRSRYGLDVWESALLAVYKHGSEPFSDAAMNATFWSTLESVVASSTMARVAGVEPGPALRPLAITAGDLPAFRHLLAVALERLHKDEAHAQAACNRAMDAKARHPVGSSRARLTTLNARWASAAEHRDRVRDARVLAEQLLARAGGGL